MKKSVGVLVLVGIVTGFGCTRKTKVVTPEDVGKSLATVLCEKYTSCEKDAKDTSATFNKDQCLQNITTGITDRMKGKTTVKVEQAMLASCSKAITGGTCEVLSNDTPPTGCEFLQ